MKPPREPFLGALTQINNLLALDPESFGDLQIIDRHIAPQCGELPQRHLQRICKIGKTGYSRGHENSRRALSRLVPQIQQQSRPLISWKIQNLPPQIPE